MAFSVRYTVSNIRLDSNNPQSGCWPAHEQDRSTQSVMSLETRVYNKIEKMKHYRRTLTITDVIFTFILLDDCKAYGLLCNLISLK